MTIMNINNLTLMQILGSDPSIQAYDVPHGQKQTDYDKPGYYACSSLSSSLSQGSQSVNTSRAIRAKARMVNAEPEARNIAMNLS